MTKEKQVSNELPPVGSTIKITGTHPWANTKAVVLSHAKVGMGWYMAKVRLVTDDAHNGHECYVPRGEWRKHK